MKKVELEMLLFQNTIRTTGFKRCMPGDKMIAGFEMYKMEILNALYDC